MPSPFAAGAVVYAKDVTRLSRFYAELFGLEVTERAPRHVVLALPPLQLVVVAMAPRIAAQVEIASPPVVREDTAVKLWLAVPDLAAARETAARLGGGLKGAECEWDFQGGRVCDGFDPEGNVIQVRASKL